MDLFEYLFRSFIVLTLLHLVYITFLQRETYFKTNRLFLLSSVIFALLFPFIHIASFAPQLPQNFNVLFETINIYGDEKNGIASKNSLALSIISYTYIIGVGIFILRFIFQIGQILSLRLKFGVTYSNGLRIVFTDKEYSPFSFFKYIFINRAQIPTTEYDKIIAHEKVHANQLHSIDLMIFEILRIIHWFNPLLWFYKYSLTEVHEYLADEGVLMKGYDKKKYQYMLVSESFGTRINYLNNSFNQSLIKNRIMMMKKNRSTNWAKLKYLIALPVISFVIFAFSNGTTTINKKNTYEEPQRIENNQVKDSTFSIVETMPIFNPKKNKTKEEGDRAIQKFIMNNVNYPNESREQGVQGKIYVGFVVDTDGKVINVKVRRSSAEKPMANKNKKSKKIKMVKCDATVLENEALRVIRSFPTFSPGMQEGKPVKVQFTIPIIFRLD